MWYDFYNGRAFSQIWWLNSYHISENYDKILIFRYISILVSIVISSVLLYIALRILKRKKKLVNKSSFNIEKKKKKKSESVDNNSFDMNDLLSKLNPSNYMNPYDAEKVKIANDLYSALLQSQGNETLISMIKDKASAELGIEL